jgi:hypothetical protein
VTRAVSLPSDAWSDYFRGIPRECGQVLAMVTLQTPRSGRDGVAATIERTLRAIRYDPRRDVLELSVGGAGGRGPSLRYFVSTPRQIVVEESPRCTEILIEDAGGQLTTIALRRTSLAPGPALDPLPMGFAADPPPGLEQGHGDRAARRAVCPHGRRGAQCLCRTYLRGPRRGAN